MRDCWSDVEAQKIMRQLGPEWGEALALRTYTSRLIGSERALVLHGGGNTSVKDQRADLLGRIRPVLCVKGSGMNLARIEPRGHVALDMTDMGRLRELQELTDADMVNFLRTRLLDARDPTPSIEALLHAFIPARFIDHSHADAILALTNREGGQEAVREALGADVIILPYAHPGFDLAKTAAKAYDDNPGARGMVLMHHGLITWGESARESYRTAIELVSQAEAWLENNSVHNISGGGLPALDAAHQSYRELAPRLRGLLAVDSNDPDRPVNRVILRSLISPEVLNMVDSEHGRDLLVTPPLTTDHLIRTKSLPMWAAKPESLQRAIETYIRNYEAYFKRFSYRATPGVEAFDPLPRVILMPGLGAICVGHNAQEAEITRDITGQTIAVKRMIAASSGSYKPLDEEQLFDMEYYAPQVAKLGDRKEPPLGRTVALVTGAAGAIGSGVCRTLLENGCHVAATDLEGPALDSLVEELATAYPHRVIGPPMDVADPAAVAEAFGVVAETWGGVDLVVINAGLAHVSSLAEMALEDFRRLERVNVEGTLNLLSESGRCFAEQNTGGDIILISTKNVFAPGAQFGAYSATKAASHQLARIASLEMAPMGVRVNMVSPDAVFSDGARRSGLWAEVGPDRMKARGLDEKGLEAYYHDRNLLKARITADHVGRAVLFFATRQTPTTGATIPVDGGLPDATPR